MKPQPLILATFMALAAMPVFAADSAALFKDKTCWSCHGKDAKTPILPEYPKIAGQNAKYAEAQMHDIKSGARANGNTAAMKAVMTLVNDEEIKALADYLSKLKP
ncbi:c-type cytochrome [Azonexus sp.]|jgi:cytochrome c|uniref:c-type cytochrome n=1 Tax=Azonexus sp. TaxID=1872668 RepID=UPI002837F9CB|nr:c-type cytochrome [Azonexus sp.]MDR1994630.1 c-type cytochrome [Azonexus sp.]